MRARAHNQVKAGVPLKPGVGLSGDVRTGNRLLSQGGGWPIQTSVAPRFVVFEAWARCCRSLEILMFGCHAGLGISNLLLPSGMPSHRKPRRLGQPISERPGAPFYIAWPGLLISLTPPQCGCPVLRAFCEGREPDCRQNKLLRHTLTPLASGRKSLPSLHSPGQVQFHPAGRSDNCSTATAPATPLVHVLPDCDAYSAASRHAFSRSTR